MASKEIVAHRFGTTVRPDLEREVVNRILWMFRKENPGVMTKEGTAYVFPKKHEKDVRAFLMNEQFTKEAMNGPKVITRSVPQTITIDGEKHTFRSTKEFRVEMETLVNFLSKDVAQKDNRLTEVEGLLNTMSENFARKEEQVAEMQGEIDRLVRLLRNTKQFAMEGLEINRLRRQGIKPVFRVPVVGRRVSRQGFAI